MSVGGRRDGAGCKPGSVNKMSQFARDEAAKTGELPHEFLLRVSRGGAVQEYTPSFQERIDAAKAAAPYFAPKLSTTAVDANVSVGNRSARELTNEEPMAIAAGGLSAE